MKNKKHYLLTLSLACPQDATEEDVERFEENIIELAKIYGYQIGGTSLKI